MQSLNLYLKYFFLFTNVLLLNIKCIQGQNNKQHTYYIASTNGNDNQSGTTRQTAWKTIDKLNASFNLINPGDSILFKTDDTFYGTIVVKNSGNKDAKIVISSYGTGKQPIITGFSTLTGWKNEGSGIYSASFSSVSQTNMVTIDGAQFAMGRYPDKEYLQFQSFNGNSSITDNNLGPNINWKGAEAVIRKNDWSIERCSILNQNGNTLTYVSKSTTQVPNANFGYFIQNDLRTLSTYGEWFHDTIAKKLYMFFGSRGPANKEVKAASINNLLYVDKKSYLTVDNLHFTGSISDAVKYTYVDNYDQFQNCTISFAGANGILLLDASNNDSIFNNVISYCNENGVLCLAKNSTIVNNKIYNIGNFAGQGVADKSYNGIFTIGDGIDVKNNVIRNVGGSGILLKYNGSATIHYNLIDTVGTMLNDEGGIYTPKEDAGKRTIDHNIIMNVFGNIQGTYKSSTITPAASGAGIYLDENANNLTVTNNIIINVPYAGIKIHKGYNNSLMNNILYQVGIGFDFENWTGISQMSNNEIENNTILPYTSNQPLIKFLATSDKDKASFMKADNNYYADASDQENANLITFKISGQDQLQKTKQMLQQGNSNGPTSANNVQANNFIKLANDKVASIKNVLEQYKLLNLDQNSPSQIQKMDNSYRDQLTKFLK